MVFKLSPSPKNLSIHLLKNLRVSGPWRAKAGQRAGASGSSSGAQRRGARVAGYTALGGVRTGHFCLLVSVLPLQTSTFSWSVQCHLLPHFSCFPSFSPVISPCAAAPATVLPRVPAPGRLCVGRLDELRSALVAVLWAVGVQRLSINNIKSGVKQKHTQKRLCVDCLM